jgi:hypothetical protein
MPIGRGSLFSPNLNGNMYSLVVMDVIHTLAKMGYDRFQLCRWLDMKIRLWTRAHKIIFIFTN